MAALYGFFHGVHVIAHYIRVAFDAINHSGSAQFIYPMFGLLIFVIIMATRNRGGGGHEGTGGSSHTLSPPYR
jgi:hypothetical protein